MIINCPDCNKKFEIDENLIPNHGRLLQCGSCNHKWFFKLKTNDEIIENETNTNTEKIFTENIESQKKDLAEETTIKLAIQTMVELNNIEYKSRNTIEGNYFVYATGRTDGTIYKFDPDTGDEISRNNLTNSGNAATGGIDINSSCSNTCCD